MTLRTALVTCGGGLQGLAVIAALRRIPQMRVLVVDNTVDSPGRYAAERYIMAPPIKDESAFIDMIEGICRQEGVEVVLPSTEHELDLLALYATRLRATGARVLSSPAQVLRLAGDKLELHRWLRANDLPSPATEADPSLLESMLPLLGKPRRGWGGNGHRILSTPDDVRAACAKSDATMVWQPLMSDFDEYSVDFAINEAADLSPLAIRRRARTAGGFALIGDMQPTGKLHDLAGRCARAVAQLGGLGLFNLQIICVGEDAWITDLNPRVGTSLPLSLAAGLDPVGFLLGQASPEPQVRQRSIRFMQERVVRDLDARQVKGVVFDLDDTLLDHKDWIARKLELLWTQRRSVLPGRDQFLESAYCLLEEGHRSDLLDAVCREFALNETARLDLIAVYRSVVPDGCRLYGDVLPALDELRRRGFRLGLLTDNPAESQRRKVSVAQLADRFDSLVFTSDLEQRKPATQCFSAVAHALQIQPAQLAMVGDHLYRDSFGALRSGFGLAFQVRREGAMFDFSTARLATKPHDMRLVLIESLTELFWYLPQVAP